MDDTERREHLTKRARSAELAEHAQHRTAVFLGGWKGAAVLVEAAIGRLQELGDTEGADDLSERLASLRAAITAELESRPAPALKKTTKH